MPLQKQRFIQGDYKELVNLVLLYLTGDNGNEHGSNFNRPGALHRARWMSKMIYCLKIDLLSDKIVEKLPKGNVFGSGQQQKIQRFVQFFIFCYVSWWLTAPIPASAPLNDLMLLKRPSLRETAKSGKAKMADQYETYIDGNYSRRDNYWQNSKFFGGL